MPNRIALRMVGGEGVRMRRRFPWLVALGGLLVVLSWTQGYGLGAWIDEHQADGIDVLPLLGLALAGVVLLSGGLVAGLSAASSRRDAALARRAG